MKKQLLLFNLYFNFLFSFCLAVILGQLEMKNIGSFWLRMHCGFPIYLEIHNIIKQWSAIEDKKNNYFLRMKGK